MRICAISDLHGHLPGYIPADTPPWKAELLRRTAEIQPCDILLIGGDILLVWDHSLFTQAQHLAGPFTDWLNQVPAKHVVAVAGNHDWIFQKRPDLVPKSLRWHYLQDSGIELEGLRIYGSPWQKRYCNWAFNAEEDELASRWARIPDDIDILLLHGPPQGWGDRATDDRGSGSLSLRERILVIKPKLTVFGHVHADYGVWNESWGTLANVSLRNVSYDVVNEPMYFEVNP